MWMKIDDGLHAHRKTRAVTKGHPSKVRDAAPMGLWVLAGSWSAQNGMDGWVPEDELDRWDDSWRSLADRLVRAGYWWTHVRDGEAGYGFTDWHDYNDPADLASKSGTYGNHVRWHVNEARVDTECQHCPKEPENQSEDRGDIAPESGGDRGAISGGDSRFTSPPIALPEPEPEPEPVPNPSTTLSDQSDDAHLLMSRDEPPNRFEEFWGTYGHKVGRKKCETAYRAALKKPGVTATLLIVAAGEYVAWCRESNTYIKNPLTWLHGEHWTDERAARAAPQTRVGQHMALVQQLAERESTNLQIGPS